MVTLRNKYRPFQKADLAWSVSDMTTLVEDQHLRTNLTLI